MMAQISRGQSVSASRIYERGFFPLCITKIPVAVGLETSRRNSSVLCKFPLGLFVRENLFVGMYYFRKRTTRKGYNLDPLRCGKHLQTIGTYPIRHDFQLNFMSLVMLTLDQIPDSR